jgi:RHS repeat-associated protein
MTLAEKFTGTNDTYAGKVAYRYCLSCDSVLSERIEYSPSSSTTITNWKRYEYDGLNLLRIDEKYDTAGGALDENDPWRTVEVNTHKPGSLGALMGKRVYQYTNAADSTPNNPALDYTYTYDALGNVQAVFRASGSVGEIAQFFTQDAFGNELSADSNLPTSNRTNLFGSTTWATARSAGITEHQTGKIQSAFSGLQYFHARWYDPIVGRFVSKDPELMRDVISSIRHEFVNPYHFNHNNPLLYVDMDAAAPVKPPCKPKRKKGDPPITNPSIYYGNYCGPGTDIDLKCKSIDREDECCRQHDLCYWTYGLNPNVHGPKCIKDYDQNICKQKHCCDKILCDCSRDAWDQIQPEYDCSPMQPQSRCSWHNTDKYFKGLSIAFRCGCDSVRNANTTICSHRNQYP